MYISHLICVRICMQNGSGCPPEAWQEANRKRDLLVIASMAEAPAKHSLNAVFQRGVQQKTDDFVGCLSDFMGLNLN